MVRPITPNTLPPRYPRTTPTEPPSIPTTLPPRYPRTNTTVPPSIPTSLPPRYPRTTPMVPPITPTLLSQTHLQNNKLKRQSQLLFAKLGVMDIPMDEIDAITKDCEPCTLNDGETVVLRQSVAG